jgi:hypothetical protein
MSKIQIPYSKVMPSGAYALVTLISGKTYVVPAWIEVPVDTKHEDIEIIGKPAKPVANRKELQIKSSSGKTYKVVLDSHLGNSCDCVGYMYHRNCRHIKQAAECNK